jgi:5,6-dimethylbenzimidazole synthase
MTLMSEARRSPPDFDARFRRELEALYRWRRDVRRFRTDPIDPVMLERLIGLAALAPSVGNAQPWRFVQVDDGSRRAAIRRVFENCNREALADYHGERAALYARLKLSGLDDAPVHLAVFVDPETALGQGLGRRTMPETLTYSVVGAVHALWLAARAHGIGLGWVSIIDPTAVRDILAVPDVWQLVAYLCVGYPQEEHLDPELERSGWQARVDVGQFIVRR